MGPTAVGSSPHGTGISAQGEVGGEGRTTGKATFLDYQRTLLGRANAYCFRCKIRFLLM